MDTRFKPILRVSPYDGMWCAEVWIRIKTGDPFYEERSAMLEAALKHARKLNELHGLRPRL